jgi:hypothetical protein
MTNTYEDEDLPDLSGSFYEGDWPGVLAEVARRAAKDGLRLEIVGDRSDPDNLRIRLTDKPEHSARRVK